MKGPMTTVLCDSQLIESILHDGPRRVPVLRIETVRGRTPSPSPQGWVHGVSLFATHERSAHVITTN